jgi:hypothetical protein
MIPHRSASIVGRYLNPSLALEVLDILHEQQLDEDENVVASTCLDQNHVVGLTGLV